MEDRSVLTQQEDGNVRNKSKIYFFVIAIAALLLTNVYFFVKYKSSGEKLYTIALQREELQREIDRVESELDNVSNSNVGDFTPELARYELSARETIRDLRLELDDVNISLQKLQEAKNIITNLKKNVTLIKDESEELRLQNEILRKENEILNAKVQEKVTELSQLEANNSELNKKVSSASSIKVSNIVVNGVKVNRRNEYENDTKAKRIDKLQIKFTIADNSLAKIGVKDIYVRVIDPLGNLIAESNNLFDTHDGSVLQYTFKEKLKFTNKGEEYEFMWSGNDNFVKGAYTILLYADGSIMGRSSVLLK